jgi:hypothetical protein
VIATLHDLHATAPRGPSVWTSLEQLAGIRFIEVSGWKWVLIAAGGGLAVCGAMFLIRRLARVVPQVRLGRGELG